MLSKQTVEPEEQIKVSVFVRALTAEPVMYRFPFVLGRGKPIVAIEKAKEPEMYRLPFKLGSEKGGIK